jgi:hypothetical protein
MFELTEHLGGIRPEMASFLADALVEGAKIAWLPAPEVARVDQ